MTLKIYPKKSLCGSLFGVLSQEMRRINFFLGVQENGAFWVGGKKFMLKKFMCLFGPLQKRIPKDATSFACNVQETPTRRTCPKSTAFVRPPFVRQYGPFVSLYLPGF